MYDFGLSDEQFWSLTPPQFAALSARHDNNQQAQDLRFGIVASVMANIHRDPKTRKKPFAPTDFMPRYDAGEENSPAPAKEMTPQQILDYLKAIFPSKNQANGEVKHG